MKRRILGILVISLGVCAALPFRTEAIKAPVAGGDTVATTGVLHSPNALTLQLAVSPTPVTALPSDRNLPTRVAEVAQTMPTPPPQEVRRDRLQTPPSIASAFEPLITKSLVETFPVAVEAATPRATIDTPQQRHRIADGDTLEILAERYFGDRSQWREIFAANTGLLKETDVLPIGVEIVIPQHRLAPPSDTDDHLVPIPAGLLNRIDE